MSSCFFGFDDVDEERLFYGSGGTAISKTLLLLQPIVLSRACDIPLSSSSRLSKSHT
jgi:hypothetical protein